MTRQSPPKTKFIDELEPIGAPEGRKRWRHPEQSRIYEWDAFHGELEVYSKRGRHVGVVDPETGEFVKDAVNGRKIKV